MHLNEDLITIGDLKVSDTISQGLQKHWDRVCGQCHFPYYFHTGARKIHLHTFFDFLKKCGNDQLVLTFLIKFWVFSDIWTEASIETRQVLKAFSSYSSLGVKVHVSYMDCFETTRKNG